jgi:DNA-binding MarR family transcriptional regulator
MTSVQLAEILHLEKSSVSRMVRKLVECGELRETSDADDARIKPLSLTPKGRRTLAALQDFGRRQVSGALARLTGIERKIVRDGLVIYARALKAGRAAETGLAEPVI